MGCMLKFCETLYSSSGVYDYIDLGARKILANYIGVESKICERICISHGIDFGHLKFPQDVNLPHPIHWSYNDDIHLRLGSRKVSFQMAHPWLLLKHDYQPRRNSILVLGPTPGPRNNAAVESKLRELGISNFDILIKKRGNIEEDINFWEKRGVGVVTAGDSDENFLIRLSSIMSRYETLVSCYISSALVFGAALGMRLRIFSCPLNHYETRDYARTVSYNETMIRFAKLVHYEDADAYYNLSLDLLGMNLMKTPTASLNELSFANDAASGSPIYLDPAFSFRKIRISALLLTKRKGFVTQELSKENLLNYLRPRGQFVSSLMADDLNIAINGLNENNFKLKLVEYVKGVTEPGMGQ